MFPTSSSLHKHQQVVSNMDSSKKLTVIYTWQNKNMIFWILRVKLIQTGSLFLKLTMLGSYICPELPPYVSCLTGGVPLNSTKRSYGNSIKFLVNLIR